MTEPSIYRAAVAAAASRRGTRDHNCDAVRVRYGSGGDVIAVVVDGTGNSAALEHLVDVIAEVSVRAAERRGSMAALIAAGDLLLEEEAAAVLVYAPAGEPATVSWIGDCRAYGWNGAELKQYTTDHTMGAQLRASGGVPANIAATHDHWLLIGLSSATPATVRQVWIPDSDDEPGEGDIVLLTSDGVHDQVPHDDLVALIGRHGDDPQALADAIVAAVPGNDDWYRDDATVAVLAYR